MPTEEWLRLVNQCVRYEDLHAARAKRIRDARSLAGRLGRLSVANRSALMTAKQHKALAMLPPMVEIWRGCYAGINENGIAWSLNRTVTARFPFLSRYRIADAEPILLKAVVQSRKLVYIGDDRNEAEVLYFGRSVAEQCLLEGMQETRA